MKTPWEFLQYSRNKIKKYLENCICIGIRYRSADPSSRDAVGYSES